MRRLASAMYQHTKEVTENLEIQGREQEITNIEEKVDSEEKATAVQADPVVLPEAPSHQAETVLEEAETAIHPLEAETTPPTASKSKS